MNFAACCSDLEKLIAKPDKEKGLGLLWVINKRGARASFLNTDETGKSPSQMTQFKSRSVRIAEAYFNW
jgi:hypothetical protein